MGRIVRLTERDLTRLVRRVIREESEESNSFTSAIKTAKQKYAAGEKNPSMEKQIKSCITGKRLSSLAVLTTSAGSYALGIMALALATPGVQFVAGGALAISGITLLLISESGILGGERLSADVGKLFECLF
jgi:hypothetical protein